MEPWSQPDAARRCHYNQVVQILANAAQARTPVLDFARRALLRRNLSLRQVRFMAWNLATGSVFLNVCGLCCCHDSNGGSHMIC